jgi:hypothetical protein
MSLNCNVQFTPEDLRVLHNAYTFLFEYQRHNDKVGIEDEYYRIVFRPRTDEELHTLNKIRLRTMQAMNAEWQALPDNSPLLDEYRDKAELWVPFPHEVPHIEAIINS